MPLGAPDERAFRKTMSKFPTGVAVITTRDGGFPRGATASAFAAVATQPPMVLLSASSTRLPLDRQDRFAISVLARHQHAVALRFDDRRRLSSATAFDGVAWWPASVSGAPVLSGALAWFDCVVHDLMPAGQQTVVVGRVHDLGHVDGEPLLAVDGGYRGLDHPAPPPLFPNAGLDGGAGLNGSAGLDSGAGLGDGAGLDSGAGRNGRPDHAALLSVVRQR